VPQNGVSLSRLQAPLFEEDMIGVGRNQLRDLTGIGWYYEVVEIDTKLWGQGL
jgi:hypothetical protein